VKRALVTGASAGIGAGFARRLAKDGWALVLVARRRERLEALREELGGEVEVLAADLASEAGVNAAAERVARGDLELLVNNAGFGTIGAFAELPLAREMAEIDLLVRAVVRLTHAGLSGMIPRGRGGILNVASMAAFQPVPFNAVYAASKAFVLSFSESVHEEARPHGVTVTCTCLGPVRTEFQRVAKLDGKKLPHRKLMRAMARTGIDEVVEASLRAVLRGDAVCVPGALNAVIAKASQAVPRPIVRRMSGRVYRGQKS